jgi:hypothetical protein
MRHLSFVGAAVILWILALTVSQGAGPISPSAMRNHPAIQYNVAPVHDSMTDLQARIASGAVKLEYEPVHGYLRSILKALDVPVESQVLVFSKTSFQAPKISPDNPRALYYNDHVAVGFVRTGDYLEFVDQDPAQGANFYTLENRPDAPLEFKRNNIACILCHTAEATDNVPGFFLGSVYPEPDGTTAYGPAITTDQRTPFENRYGGWYVLGEHHGRHMGNAVVRDQNDLRGMVTPETSHLMSLEGKFDMTGYLTPYSDLVSLLVLEHQVGMMNQITRIGWEARIGATDVGRPLNEAAADFVDYMLFIDEAKLPGPIHGVAGFEKVFEAAGVRDHEGRSLRDLDLNTRLMKYPCSYMIYTKAFDALPDNAKTAIYARLWEILSGKETGERYNHLTAADRKNIVDILLETKKGLPDYFKPLG